MARTLHADLGFYKKTNIQEEFNVEIQEESTSYFYEDAETLKSLMDVSSDGHKGPLLPLVWESKQVSSVIPRPVKLKQRPLTWSVFHNWLKNTILSHKKPQYTYKECSSYDIQPADSDERVFEKYRALEHDVNVRKELHAGVSGGKKYGTALPLMPYQRFMKNQEFC